MKSFRPDAEDEHEEGNSFWISVSDIMAGLTFIFIIILIMFSIQFKKQQNEFIEAKKELQSPATTRLQVLKELVNVLKDNGLEVESYPEEGLLRLSDNTLSFPVAKAFPDSDRLGNLGKLAKALTTILPCYSVSRPNLNKEVAAPPEWCQPLSATPTYQCHKDYKGTIETVMIEGHTDAMMVKAGAGYLDNLALSAARATTVLRLLKLCDPSLGELYNKKGQPLVGAGGYADLRPISLDNPLNPKNRRIDIRFMMDLPDNALEGDNLPISQLSSQTKLVR